MRQVTVTVNGRTYRLSCGDDEEERLQRLADYVAGKVDELAGEFGQVGEERLLLMAALLIGDELFDARESRATLDAGEPGDTRALAGVDAEA